MKRINKFCKYPSTKIMKPYYPKFDDFLIIRKESSFQNTYHFSNVKKEQIGNKLFT